MKRETVNGEMATAFGKPVTSYEGVTGPVKYSTEVELFESFDELKAANALPSNDDLVDMVNARRKNNARQAAMAKALTDAGIQKPTLETSEELRYKNIYDALRAAKKSHEEADAIARSSLGI